MRKAFDAVLSRLGPRSRCAIDSAKTTITLRAGSAFAGFKPRRDALEGELLLDGPHHAACFHKVWALSARSWVHHFRLRGPEDLGAELAGFLEEALARASPSRRRRASPSPPA